jgi:hypothetical protein
MDVWNVLFNAAFTAGSMGDSLTNATYVQGAAAGLSAAEILDTLFNRDSSAFDEGWWHKIANRSDSGGAGGGGSDTTAILAMLLNNLFARVTVDTPIIIGDIEVGVGAHMVLPDSSAGDISYIANNAAAYKATGFSSHSAADVWSVGTRALTDKIGFALTSAEHGLIEDEVYANRTQYMANVTALSTHSELDVYNQFIAGSNEDAFKADVSGLSTFDETTDSVMIAQRDSLAQLVADSVGTITASVDTAAIATAVWKRGRIGGDYTQNMFGYYLDAPISAISSPAGSGPFQCTLVVVDSGGTGTDTVITETNVYVANEAQDATAWYDYISTADGEGYFQLSSGTFVAYIMTPGFAQVLDTFNILGNQTETLYVYRTAGSRVTVAFGEKVAKPDGSAFALAKYAINLESEYDDSVLRVGAPANSNLRPQVEAWRLSTCTRTIH